MLNAFGMNDYGIPIIGTMDDIHSITIEDLQKWYELYYQPNNAVVIIAGNFNRDEVKRYLQEYYGSIKNIEKNQDETEKNDFQPKPSFTVYDKVSQPIVFLSFTKPKFNKDKMRELYALDLFVEIMD
jgi:zinc protease